MPLNLLLTLLETFLAAFRRPEPLDNEEAVEDTVVDIGMLLLLLFLKDVLNSVKLAFLLFFDRKNIDGRFLRRMLPRRDSLLGDEEIVLSCCRRIDGPWAELNRKKLMDLGLLSEFLAIPMSARMVRWRESQPLSVVAALSEWHSDDDMNELVSMDLDFRNFCLWTGQNDVSDSHTVSSFLESVSSERSSQKSSYVRAVKGEVLGRWPPSALECVRSGTSK
ncbi:hypothetical protein V2A60_001327 [Cordyceps javanica]